MNDATSTVKTSKKTPNITYIDIELSPITTKDEILTELRKQLDEETVTGSIEGCVIAIKVEGVGH